ncbi:MAG TPA: hypothetical protein VKE98_12860 [Gemmataceae bacterium]|nr:hypothetical protein [Gemmataceae bacterium]
MSRVILKSELRSRLDGLREPVEFCDETGKTLGHFVPEPLYRELLVARSKARLSDEELERRRREFLVDWSKAHLSDEELERRRQEPHGRALAEILKSLNKT